MSETWNIEASTKGHFQISWSCFLLESKCGYILVWQESIRIGNIVLHIKNCWSMNIKMTGFTCGQILTFYINFQLLERSHSQVPHTRPETPRCLTHNHDEDYSDEESDSKSSEEKAGWLYRLHCGGNRSTGLSENPWPCTRGQGISLVLVAALLCDQNYLGSSRKSLHVFAVNVTLKCNVGYIM